MSFATVNLALIWLKFRCLVSVAIWIVQIIKQSFAYDC